ncbi:MAG: SDR family NAD(P)-dependent oxidoreductase, partial [Bacteroidia bacterium]|nr:SDR family NAD(P)-dependent oxidoreductase [Bacteroidia bacterium]
MKYSVREKVVVITGSSMGIGKSLANLLGRSKAKLVINGRDKEKLLATQQELKNLGYEVIHFSGDVSQEADCKNLVAATLQHFGRIDILINNAGVSMRGITERLSPEVISTVFKINAIAPVMLAQMV